MRDTLQSLLPEGKSSRLLLASAGLGVAVAFVVGVFEYVTVELVLEGFAHTPVYVQALMPMVGLVLTVFALRYLGNGATPSTSDEYITAYHARHPKLPARLLPARLIAGATTIGFGGALGLEGPSIYTGSVLGLSAHARLNRWLGRDAAKLLLTAGSAAGVAAIFQAPATGVMFALEAPYRDDLAHRALLPSLIASASSFLTFNLLPFIHPHGLLGQVTSNGIGVGDLLGAVAIGIGAGFGGRGYAWLIRRAKAISKAHDPLKLAVGGGALLGLLAFASDLLFDAPLTLGPGGGVVDWLSDTERLVDGKRTIGLILILFVFRGIATMVTVGAGGTGGLFIPLAVQGILLGRFVSSVLDQLGLGESPDRIWPILGLAAFLAAGYRTPIAAVMFVAETTAVIGTDGVGSAVVPALIAAAVSQLVAGRSSVSAGQRVERLGHLEERFAMPLAAALTTDVLSVPSDATVSEFVWIHALGRRVRVVPVVDGGQYLGLCSVEACAEIDRSLWEETTVAEVLSDEMPRALPSWSLRDAVAAMEKHQSDTIAVTDAEGIFIGVVLESEIVKLGEILDQTGGSYSPF